MEVNSTVDNISLGAGANISIFAHVKNNGPMTDEFQKPELYQYVSVTIGENNAYQKKGYGTGGAFFKETLFYGSQYNYKIVFSDKHNDNAKVDLADKIIATFKFTK